MVTGTINAVTAEMRRLMPNACSDWADRIDAALAGVTVGSGNPPAFPAPNAYDEFTHGMTLRDWFAGHALTTLHSFQDGPVPGEDFAEQASIAAEWSYEIADAMLAARVQS